jgi:hypothetical protein
MLFISSDGISLALFTKYLDSDEPEVIKSLLDTIELSYSFMASIRRYADLVLLLAELIFLFCQVGQGELSSS